LEMLAQGLVIGQGFAAKSEDGLSADGGLSRGALKPATDGRLKPASE
jgi:hypothetical protein